MSCDLHIIHTALAKAWYEFNDFFDRIRIFFSFLVETNITRPTSLSPHLRGSHGNELYRLLVAQLKVAPLPHGEDGLRARHAVVRNQNLLNIAAFRALALWSTFALKVSVSVSVNIEC